MGLRYNRGASHVRLKGVDESGAFRATPAQRYTSEFSAALAVDTLCDVMPRHCGAVVLGALALD